MSYSCLDIYAKVVLCRAYCALAISCSCRAHLKPCCGMIIFNHAMPRASPLKTVGATFCNPVMPCARPA